jgi:rubredoxin
MKEDWAGVVALLGIMAAWATVMVTMITTDIKRGAHEGREKYAGGWIDQELRDALEGLRLGLLPPVPAEPSQRSVASAPARIIRTYQCNDCNYVFEETLAAEDRDAPPPECPKCRQMGQDDIPMDRGEGTAEPSQRSAERTPAARPPSLTVVGSQTPHLEPRKRGRKHLKETKEAISRLEAALSSDPAPLDRLNKMSEKELGEICGCDHEEKRSRIREARAQVLKKLRD